MNPPGRDTGCGQVVCAAEIIRPDSASALTADPRFGWYVPGGLPNATASLFHPLIATMGESEVDEFRLVEVRAELLDTLVAHAWRAPTPECYTALFHLGGAVGREDPEGSAFEDRRAAHAMTIDGVWSEPNAGGACIAWARDFWEAVRPHSTGRVYVNFLGEEGQDRVRSAYGEAKYERLRALKRKYDPTNSFRMNQNIVP